MEESIDLKETTELVPTQPEQLPVLNTAELKQEANVLIQQIIQEKNADRQQDLVELFNQNQNKKAVIRINKMSDLLDILTDQTTQRLTKRPDEISNKELLDGMRIVQDLMERSTAQVMDKNENAPLIQVNNQTNEVNINDSELSAYSRESREKVKSTVLAMIKSIQQQAEAPVEISDENITIKEENLDG